jgi:tetratricopeptide (TPR) repeat protein
MTNEESLDGPPRDEQSEVISIDPTVGWAILARKHLSVREYPYINDAIAAAAAAGAADAADCLRHFLTRDVDRNVRVMQAMELASDYAQQGRREESVTMRLMALSVFATLADGHCNYPAQEWPQLLATAIGSARQAVELASFVHDDACQATFGMALAMALHANGDHEAAVAAFRDVVTLRRGLAAREPEIYDFYLAGALNNFAGLLTDLRRLPEALDTYGEALDVARRLAMRDAKTYDVQVGGTLYNMSDVLRESGRIDQAAAALVEALAIFRRLAAGDHSTYDAYLSSVLDRLGNLLSEHSGFDAAQRAYDEAMAAFGPQMAPDHIGDETEVGRAVQGGLNEQRNGLEEPVPPPPVMGKHREVYADITRFQATCWADQGVSEEQIVDKLKAVFFERMTFNSAEDPEFMRPLFESVPLSMTAIYDEFRDALDGRGLPFQCPYTHLVLSSLQRSFHERTNNEELLEVLSETTGWKELPLIASAYSGSLDAFTLRAADGSRGVVFEDELLHLFMGIAHGLGAMVSRRQDKLFVVDMDRDQERNERFVRGRDWVFGSIRAMLTHGTVMQRQEGFLMPLSTDTDVRFGKSLFTGMFDFVYMHEIGHIVSQHYELLWGATARHLPRRTVAEQEQAFQKCKEKYPDLLATLRPEQIQNFLTRQMMEIEADSMATLSLINQAMEIAQGRDPGIAAVGACLGSLSVILLFRVIESMALMIHHGMAWQDYPHALLSTDDLVQNLCFRSSHPSPLNRMKNMVDALQDERLIDSLAERPEAEQAREQLVHLFTRLEALIITAFFEWLETDEGFRTLELGSEALLPRWRHLIDELPPLS